MLDSYREECNDMEPDEVNDVIEKHSSILADINTHFAELSAVDSSTYEHLIPQQLKDLIDYLRTL